MLVHEVTKAIDLFSPNTDYPFMETPTDPQLFHAHLRDLFVKVFIQIMTISMISGALHAQDKDHEKKALKSGPQIGETARPYHPLLANGKTTGQRWCMVCTYRGRCKAMILAFVRKHDGRANQLIAAVEAAIEKHEGAVGIITFLTTEGKTAKEVEALTGGKVAYLSDAEKERFDALGKLAKKDGIKSSLNIYSTDGPAGYKLSPEAALTVLVADSSAVVKTNVALRDSEFTDQRIKGIAEEIEGALSK